MPSAVADTRTWSDPVRFGDHRDTLVEAVAVNNDGDAAVL